MKKLFLLILILVINGCSSIDIDTHQWGNKRSEYSFHDGTKVTIDGRSTANFKIVYKDLSIEEDRRGAPGFAQAFGTGFGSTLGTAINNTDVQVGKD